MTREDLLGRWWVADFIFTRCNGICPLLTSRMAELDRALARVPGGENVRLVSFTVDPGYDTPEVLRSYADALPGGAADPARWLFLTGPADDLYRLIGEGFMLGVAPEPPGEDGTGELITHSDRFALVDPGGRIRGYYHGMEEDTVARLTADLRRLVAPSPLPAVNAALNSIAAVLLALGYVLIRRKKTAAHRACMIAALAVSTVFLLSYLYYHAHAGSVRFTGTGWVRPVYFFVLISHIILAAAIVPMAILTAYRALRGQYDRHRAIARWTWPAWMYVSVTGVAVYVMLYRL